MEIITFGSGVRLELCRRALSRCVLSPLERLIVLPVPSAGAQGCIKGTDIPLSEAVRLSGKGSAVAGYGLPSELCRELFAEGAAVYDAAEDEEFLLENARLTANAALGHILSDFKTDVSEMKVAIVGYGRIGSYLVKELLFLGASVTVFTTRRSVAEGLCSAGVSAREVSDEGGFSGFDLVINTAPARLFSENTAGISDRTVYDLASGSFLPPLSNIKKLSALPEKNYPETAGRLYAKGIMRAFGLGGMG